VKTYFIKKFGEPKKHLENLKILNSLREDKLTFMKTAWLFIKLGVKHILSGLDHILFVLALILVPLGWRKTFLMISAFTVAHSITLILAGTNTLTLSSRIVEPVIAFSIVYVVFTSVFAQGNTEKISETQNLGFLTADKKTYQKKLAIVFLFGLFHGLGFAGLFEELSIPAPQFWSALLFFNVGVEFGQFWTIIDYIIHFTFSFTLKTFSFLSIFNKNNRHNDDYHR